MSKCAVGKLRDSIDTGVLQFRVDQNGFRTRVSQIREGFCILTFWDKEDKDRCLGSYSDFLGSWFDELQCWQGSNLTVPNQYWVCLSGVQLCLWHEGFFRMVRAELGWLVEVSRQTAKRLDLRDTWIKVDMASEYGWSSVLEVESTKGLFRIGVKAMRVVNALPRVVSGKTAGLDSSSEDESVVSPFKGSPAFILKCRGVDEGDASELFAGSWGLSVGTDRYEKNDMEVPKSDHNRAAGEEKKLAGILDAGG